MKTRKIAPRHNGNYAEAEANPTFEIKGRKFSLEQYEMLMVKIATIKLHPKLYSDAAAAQMLGVSVQIIKKIRTNPIYTSLVENMLKEVRMQWKGEIQAVIINRAIKGSPKHIDFFFNLEKDFVNKSGAVHREDIPDDPMEKKKLIDKLLSETQDLIVPADSTNSKMTQASKKDGENAGTFNK
jgi:hypothetical protein